MAAIVLSVGCANMHAPELSVPPKGYEYSIDLAAAEAAGYRWEERDGRIIRVSISGRSGEWPADEWMEEAGYSWSQEDSYMVCFSPEEAAATFAAIYHPDESGWYDRKDYTLCHLSLFPLTVSVRGLHSSYSGGAHGNWGFFPVNYWWRDSRAKEIHLADLFDPAHDWRAILGPIARYALAEARMAKAKENGMERTIEQCLERCRSITTEKLLDEPFTFSEKGIEFYYAPYVVDCFAAGDFHAIIPIERIDNILSADGPMARWLR